MSAMQGPLLNMVVAASSGNGIGLDGQLPWRLPKEMKHFKTVTSSAPEGMTNAVVMGRKTWLSIPAKFRPLPNRLNVVLTRTPAAIFREKHNVPAQVLVSDSLEHALAHLGEHSAAFDLQLGDVFVIGGSSLFAEALASPSCGTLHLTRIHATPKCDVFLPEIDTTRLRLVDESPVHEENGFKYQFLTYKSPAAMKASEPSEQKVEETKAGGASEAASAPKPMYGMRSDGIHEEMQYLDLIRDIIDNGVERGDRTGTGTRSKFGVTMRFSLRDDVLPVFTTKRVFWRGVAEELLWFVSGSTDARKLQAKKIRIWDGNASREFLDSRGLTDREVGDLGPVYGFQWRHFGAKYVDFNTDYTGQGVDQLARVIHTIKTNPNDRRIILSAWNPADLDEMALPPCHMFCQFYVSNGELSCQMYQRSADMGLGVPFNVASYALLTRMVAQVCNLRAGDFIHVIGDAHVYLNHIEPLREQLVRKPRSFPKLRINPDVKGIDDFTYDDFTLEGYKPHKAIKMKMAV